MLGLVLKVSIHKTTIIRYNEIKYAFWEEGIGMFTKNFIRMVLPIKYETKDLVETFNLNYEKTKGDQTEKKTVKLWERTQFSSTHLLKTTKLKFDHEAKSGICDIYVLNDAARVALGLPNNQNQSLSFSHRKKDKASTIKLNTMHLFVFETNVAFLTIDIEPVVKTFDELNDTVYFLSELKSDKHMFSYERKLGKDKSETVSLKLIELVETVLKPLGHVDDFDANASGLHFSDNKPDIFGYQLLTKPTENIDKNMNLIMSGFRDSYLLSHHESASHQTIKPFENSLWGASHNTCINVSHLTSNPETNAFFEDAFYVNLKNHYFLLYILVLHQKYAMIKFTEDIAEINEVDIDQKDVYEMVKKVRRLIKQSELFYIRSYLEIPSYMDHINQFYYLLQRQCEISKFSSEFKDTLSALDHIHSSLLDKRNEVTRLKGELKKKNRDILIFAVTTIIALNPMIRNGWDVTERVAGRTLTLKDWPLYWLYALIITYGVIVFIGVRNRFIDKNAIRDKLEEKEL